MSTGSFKEGLDGEEPDFLERVFRDEQDVKDKERGFERYLRDQAVAKVTAKAVADELERRADEKSRSSYDSDLDSGSSSSSSSSSSPSPVLDAISKFIAFIFGSCVIGLILGLIFGAMLFAIFGNGDVRQPGFMLPGFCIGWVAGAAMLLSMNDPPIGGLPVRAITWALGGIAYLSVAFVIVGAIAGIVSILVNALLLDMSMSKTAASTISELLGMVIVVGGLVVAVRLGIDKYKDWKEKGAKK